MVVVIVIVVSDQRNMILPFHANGHLSNTASPHEIFPAFHTASSKKLGKGSGKESKAIYLSCVNNKKWAGSD